jgi:hypothetical protein
MVLMIAVCLRWDKGGFPEITGGVDEFNLDMRTRCGGAIDSSACGTTLQDHTVCKITG